MSGRGLLAAATIAATLLASFWLGEHNTKLLPIEDLLTVAPAVIVLPLVLRLTRRWVAVLATSLIFFGFAAAWWAGAVERMHAQNECIERGEEARLALANYFAMRGRYPSNLAELNRRLPGDLFLPPRLLHYEVTPSGYHLWFGDWLASHDANENQSFMARK